MMEKSQEQDLCITKEVDQHKPNCGEAMPFDSRENHISKTSQDQATKYHYLMTMSLCGGFLVFVSLKLCFQYLVANLLNGDNSRLC